MLQSDFCNCLVLILLATAQRVDDLWSLLTRSHIPSTMHLRQCWTCSEISTLQRQLCPIWTPQPCAHRSLTIRLTDVTVAVEGVYVIVVNVPQVPQEQLQQQNGTNCVVGQADATYQGKQTSAHCNSVPACCTNTLWQHTFSSESQYRLDVFYTEVPSSVCAIFQAVLQCRVQCMSGQPSVKGL